MEKVLGLEESLIAGDIHTALNLFVKAGKLGIVPTADGALKLLKKLIRIPDVSFISWTQLPRRTLPPKRIPNLYPDLAVEVLSDSNTAAEMQRKLKEYFLAGTRLVWYVDPETRTVKVFTSPEQFVLLHEKDALDGGDVLPGFRLPVTEVFAQPPREKRRRKRKR